MERECSAQDVILDFLEAAQTVAAVYERGGDRRKGFEAIAHILADRKLIEAQSQIGASHEKFEFVYASDIAPYAMRRMMPRHVGEG